MFKSPARKLARCFQKSRDAWKQKCQESKMKSKYWANQARAAMRSRDHWRDKAQAAEAELQTLRQTLATYQKSTPR